MNQQVHLYSLTELFQYMSTFLHEPDTVKATELVIYTEVISDVTKLTKIRMQMPLYKHFCQPECNALVYVD